jgi:MOSC domain-containing protein YiiM
MVSLPAPARVLSVNVGVVEEVRWRDRTFRTAIRKRPVDGPGHVTRLGIEGDVQGDRRVHGGLDKAVYGYAAEHQAFWEEVLGAPVGPGAFGENLTLEGLVEDEVCIGDRFRVGGALLEVSEPRQPCSTFAALHRREDLLRIFAEAGWPGIYFRVLEEGPVAAGDPVERVARGEGEWTVRQVFEWIMGRAPLPDDLDRLLDHPALAAPTREGLIKRRRAAS